MASNLAENELLQSIKQQITVEDVDYSKWERKKKPMPTSFIVGRRPLPSLESRHGSACSSLRCRHHWNRRDVLADDDPEVIAKEKRMKELLMKINVQKKTLGEMRHRKNELLHMNMEMRKTMEATESKSHGTVNVVLRRYERCRGGIASLHQRFMEEKVEKMEDLNNLKDKLNAFLGIIQKEVDEVSGDLSYVQQELQILHNYKDKEYPMRLILIDELQQTIEAIKLDNEDEQAELSRVIDSETDKLRNTDSSRVKVLKTTVAEEMWGRLDPSLDTMAEENCQLKKDIDFHRQQLNRLNAEIGELTTEIEKKKKSSTSDIRRHMFPELYRRRPKCTPDMDVVLDIPVAEPLPI